MKHYATIILRKKTVVQYIGHILSKSKSSEFTNNEDLLKMHSQNRKKCSNETMLVYVIKDEYIVRFRKE